jgi:hypothetical protein
MRKIRLLFASILVFGVSGVLAQDDAQKDNKFVGAQKCKMCHSKEKMTGTHYLIWEAESHAKAFESLGTDKAKEAAKKHGIEDPQKDEKCLNCHTVKAILDAEDKITHEEGVSCEACHGAAEKYLKPHKDEGLEGAVKLGMIPLRTMGVEEKQKICLGCHKEDPLNDFHKEFNYEEFWAKIDHSKATSQKILDKRK